ncbi:MAG: carboxypeptidase-like regulatory domain-containing protein [Mucilaginibacter sp.]|uniref:carboxypeptidase-like regulatory domain-containing protein n=1 Tax=Mucilaginibacter sp. TaxID=1882438 RepID=UPI0032644F5D
MLIKKVFRQTVNRFKSIIYWALFLISFSVCAQNKPISGGINRLVASMDEYQARMPIEKVYLQLDKPYYAVGDTIWFKAYLFDASFLSSSKKSSLLYVEVESEDSHAVLKRISLPMAAGLSWGDIALTEKSFPEGGYILRAYTNWMRNFGADYVFEKHFYVSNANDQSWLVKSQIKLDGSNNAKVALKFWGEDQRPIPLREMELQVLKGRKSIYKEKLETSLDGLLNIGFALPQNTNKYGITLLAKDLRKGEDSRQLTIPLKISQPKDIDLQFMPEGGNMVSGILVTVAFKAIGSDGIGVDVMGKIYDSKQQQVATFKSLHKGMGAFTLLPVKGESYTAKLYSPDGDEKVYHLPDVKAAGTVLKITNLFKNDSIGINIQVTSGISESNSKYYIIGQSRGVICYAAAVQFNDGEINSVIAKSLFPSGIARITLMDASWQPLNERIVYIDHHDNLAINIVANKTTFNTRDSISLQVSVKDKDGKPIAGSFSVSVTADGLVKADTLHNNSIETHLLLTSDLKGTVEEPGFYIDPQNDETWQALDDLLLTQGWVGYDWKDTFAPEKAPLFAAESELKVTGKVTNAFNKPLADTKVTLLSHKPFLMMEATTDNEGNFLFKNFALLDTASFFLQVKRNFNVGIAVDKFKPPVFKPTLSKLSPWYVNTDTTLLNYTKNFIAITKIKDGTTGKSKVLKEVQIRDKKTIKGSHNLNGSGNADQVFDEAEIKAAVGMNVYQYLVTRVKGLTFGFVPTDTTNTPVFMVNDLPITFSIDGKSVGGDYEYLKDMFENYPLASLKGIEVMHSMQYSFTYDQRNNFGAGFHGGTGRRETELPGVIEITTYSGVGWSIIHRPGIASYRPIPVIRPIQFYRPRYTVKNSYSALSDLRSTIHWEPNMITRANGMGALSFYAADIPGTYTVTLNGSDMRGNIGSRLFKIKVNKRK